MANESFPNLTDYSNLGNEKQKDIKIGDSTFDNFEFQNHADENVKDLKEQYGEQKEQIKKSTHNELTELRDFIITGSITDPLNKDIIKPGVIPGSITDPLNKDIIRPGIIPGSITDPLNKKVIRRSNTKIQ